MALPSTGITTSLVGSTIGTTSRVLSTLCTHPNINCWSVWKPIQSTATTLTYDILNNARFGLSFHQGTGTSPVALYQIWSGSTNVKGYTYNIPQSVNLKRLGDFRNYDHSAPIPYQTTFIADSTITLQANGTGLLGMETPRPNILSAATALCGEHIYGGGMTRGIMIRTTTNPITTYWSVGLIDYDNSQLKNMKGKNVTVMEFVTNAPSGTTNANILSTNYTWYSLPNGYYSATINSQTTQPEVDAVVTVLIMPSFTDTTYTTCQGRLTIKGKDGQVTLNNLTYGLMKNGSWIGSPTNAGSVSVSTGSAPSASHTINVANYRGDGSSNVEFCIFWNNTLQWSISMIPNTQINE